LFEQHADRSAGQSLAKRTYDAAGHEDMFGHRYGEGVDVNRAFKPNESF
jgi:hypothetical protein